MNDKEVITVSCEVFNNESKLRELVGLISNRMIGAASKVNSYSKDFIRQTWERINWMEIFQHWYLRYRDNHLIDFDEFMLIIDPKGEFYNKYKQEETRIFK